VKHIVRAGLFFAFLFIHNDAAAICGDVTGDGNRAATDALAVLLAATGQDIELVCAGEGPSSLRYLNDFNCGTGSANSQASFNGFEFNAASGELSDYQSVDRASIDTMVVTICGGDYSFPGPIFLPPDRKITFFVAFLNDAVYGEGRALFVLSDDGEAASALTVGADTTPSNGVVYAYGELVTR